MYGGYGQQQGYGAQGYAGYGAAGAYAQPQAYGAVPGGIPGQGQQSATVYVGNLVPHVTREELATFFSNCGRVVSVKVAGEATYEKRFGFVEFDNLYSAQMACTLTGQMLHNRPVKVELKQSTNQGNVNRGGGRAATNRTVIFSPIRLDATREDATARTVHVSGIDARTTEHDLYSFFSFSGTVNAIRMCGDPNMSTRFVFIEFADLAAASSAMNMTGQVLGNFPIKVSPAKSPITTPGQQPGGGGGGAAHHNPNPYPGASGAGAGATQPNTIHIGNLDPTITDATLTQCFTQWCGPVVTSRVSGHVDAARPTRYGFVEFENAASVATALAMDGTLLGSTNIKISPAKAPSRPPAAASHLPVASVAGVAGATPALAPPGTEAFPAATATPAAAPAATATPAAAPATAAPGTEEATEESTGGKRKASDAADDDEEDGNVAKKARVDGNDDDAKEGSDGGDGDDDGKDDDGEGKEQDTCLPMHD